MLVIRLFIKFRLFEKLESETEDKNEVSLGGNQDTTYYFVVFNQTIVQGLSSTQTSPARLNKWNYKRFLGISVSTFLFYIFTWDQRLYDDFSTWSLLLCFPDLVTVGNKELIPHPPQNSHLYVFVSFFGVILV